MKITLNEIVTKANDQFASTDVELGDGSVCVLRNVLQLPEGERAEFIAAQKALTEEGADQTAGMGACLVIAAEDKALGNKLVSAIGDNLAVMLTVFKSYGEATQVGEA